MLEFPLLISLLKLFQFNHPSFHLYFTAAVEVVVLVLCLSIKLQFEPMKCALLFKYRLNIEKIDLYILSMYELMISLLFCCSYGWLISWMKQAKLDAAKQKLGRDVRVFETSIVSQTQIDASNNDGSTFYSF